MVAPKFRHTVLFVRALVDKEVREIDESGKPLLDFRIVGKDNALNIIKEGVKIPYHSHYIARIKEGSLLPMDLATSKLAGVPFVKLS